MPYVSQLAFYDVGLSDWVDTAKTSQDSQRVVYEDPVIETRQLIAAERKLREREQAEIAAINEAESKVDLFFYSPSLYSPSNPSDIDITMENIVKYSGGGGAAQRAFIRDIKAVYQKILRDPREHLMEGFGQWEFLGLVGGLLINEARDVHSAFIDRWDFEDVENPNFEAAEDAERRRAIYRGYRRDREAYTR